MLLPLSLVISTRDLRYLRDALKCQQLAIGEETHVMVEVLDMFPSRPTAQRFERDRVSKRLELIRALHLINGEVFSGAERVQQLLGRRLAEFGYEPIFACLKPGRFAECCDLRTDQIWTEPMRHRRDLGVVDRLAQRSSEAQVQVLHAHTPRTAMIASLITRRTGIPWIYHVHSPAVRDSTRVMQNWINDCVERLSLLNVHRMITVSKSLRHEMLKRGWPRKRVISIANGVAEQEPIFAIDRIERSEWTLGMVALIRPRKGIEVLLHSFREVCQRTPHVRLDVIGGFETPEYESKVRSMTHELGIDHAVRWRGFTRDVTSALRELDVLVLPSLFGEGMPMVVLEAMAVGIPIVATRVEGTPEVVRDGREGYLAEPANAPSLAETIDKMIGDRHAWCRMSQQAWTRHRENFSDTRMAQRVAAVYDSALPELQTRVAAVTRMQTATQGNPNSSPSWAVPHAKRLGRFLVDA
jgi:glycosyltransferase involved in cell wall biosynthesis